MVQYADDLTLFLPNIECVKLILRLLDRFTICSGFKVNHTKPKAMWIDSYKQNTATPGAKMEQKCQGPGDSINLQ